jgi:uncharacterized lipoprotein YddW (UPF0748 family)
MEVYGGNGYDINSMETRALHVVPWISMGAVGAQTSNYMVSNSQILSAKHAKSMSLR